MSCQQHSAQASHPQGLPQAAAATAAGMEQGTQVGGVNGVWQVWETASWCSWPNLQSRPAQGVGPLYTQHTQTHKRHPAPQAPVSGPLLLCLPIGYLQCCEEQSNSRHTPHCMCLTPDAHCMCAHQWFAQLAEAVVSCPDVCVLMAGAEHMCAADGHAVVKGRVPHPRVFVAGHTGVVLASLIGLVLR